MATGDMVLSAALFVVLLYVVVRGETECPSTRVGAFKFSIISRRNLTGHWMAQAQLEHEAQQKEDGPWEVDIDHTTMKCENKEKIIIVATVITPPKRPGPDYELIPGLGYYKFHKTGKTWEQARDTCFEEGTHLAIPNSEAEGQAVLSLWLQHPREQLKQYIDYVFLGFHDRFKEGDYVTIFGQPLEATGFAKWAPREPSNSTSENCGCLTRAGGYNDIRCSEILPFICEQDL